MTDIFTQLALVLGSALIISLIMKALKQPLIIGYILTGILVGPSFLGFVQVNDALELFASLGIALLLFIVGLGLDPSMIKGVGPIATITGIAQIIFTSVLGFGIGIGLGFTPVTALYLAVAFTFSSTIIILQLLHDKKDQDSLYGRIAIGFLLVQDLIAMIIFIFLSSSSTITTSNVFITLSWILVKLSVIGTFIYLLTKFIVPKVDEILAKNRQVLFIFSLSTCFVMASLFEHLGFSLELGALTAGILLSTSPYHREIATRIHPLRDFFLVIFFVFLGANMELANLAESLPIVLIYSAFILIGNPLIVLLIMTKLGHTRKTAFFAGLTVAQISEFSLIMLGVGANLGQIDHSILALGTLVGLITIAASSYMIIYNEQVFKVLKPLIVFITPFAKENDTREEVVSESYDLVLFGVHRLGGGILEAVLSHKIPYLAVDHDPHLVKRLTNEKLNVLFGTADDAAFLDELDFSKTKLIISTVPDEEVNAFLIEYLSTRKPDVTFVCVASKHGSAQKLYDLGASYVVMPPYLGRRFMSDLFNENVFNAKGYEREKKKHLKDLQYIKELI